MKINMTIELDLDDAADAGINRQLESALKNAALLEMKLEALAHAGHTFVGDYVDVPVAMGGRRQVSATYQLEGTNEHSTFAVREKAKP